jgi:glycosyltransferase involved in cell wall biosynthesis
VLRVTYNLGLPRPAKSDVIGADFSTRSLYGEGALRACQALLARNFHPDIIVGHPGWGELLFIKDLLPDTPLIGYCEFYNSSKAPLSSGDPPRPPSLERRIELRAQSAHLLLSLESANCGWSPTSWQKSLHPPSLQDKIEVIFDGVDTDLIKPDPGAQFILPSGAVLRAGEEIVTFTARTLEPSRGFPGFMRALPRVLKERLGVHVIIAGSAKPHYDAGPAQGGTWLKVLQDEVTVDESRVHFVGHLRHADFVRLLQVSKVHVHLTRPTVLSWSLAEALAAGCLVLASDTPAVAEIVHSGINGLITSFGDPERIAGDIVEALDHDRAADLRANARRLAESDLSLKACLPRQADLFHKVAFGSHHG